MRLLLEEAAETLLQGGVVAVPTETVYGLAASLASSKAIEEVFALKKRPGNNPLIIHIGRKEQLRELVESFPPGFELLAEAFWPGPLTLVLPVRESAVPERARAGLPTAAFRMPAHPIALELLKKTGPLLMPSANLSGRPSATAPEHVEQDFGTAFPVLDGGVCLQGVESTILIYQEGWKIGRLGALPAAVFTPLLGEEPPFARKAACPGRLHRHYSPKALLIAGDEIPEDAEALVGFEERRYPKTLPFFSLGSLKDPEAVARNLYRTLRTLDSQKVAKAWVDLDLPEEGLWATLKERLSRAVSGCRDAEV